MFGGGGRNQVLVKFSKIVILLGKKGKWKLCSQHGSTVETFLALEEVQAVPGSVRDGYVGKLCFVALGKGPFFSPMCLTNNTPPLQEAH